jgi:hypothetical protein
MEGMNMYLVERDSAVAMELTMSVLLAVVTSCGHSFGDKESVSQLQRRFTHRLSTCLSALDTSIAPAGYMHVQIMYTTYLD